MDTTIRPHSWALDRRCSPRKLNSLTKPIQNRTNNSGLPFDLTLGRVYQILGIEADNYRLICDDLRSPDDRKANSTLRSKMPQPYLYSPQLFDVVVSSEPNFWVCVYGEGGERYCYPREWMHVGFFEDYHDHLPEAHAIFWEVYYRLYLEG